MIKFKRYIATPVLLAMLIILASCSDQSNSEQQLLQTAKTYLEKRDLSAASIELKNTLLINAHNAEARFLLAGIHLETGNLEGAEKEYKRAADAGWSAGDIELGTSKVLMAQYRFRNIVDNITIKDDWPLDTRADLLGIYAAAEASIGNIEQAKSTLATGVELKADAFQVVKTTAIFHLVAGEPQEAISSITQVLAKYSNNAELLLLKAVAEQQQKNFTEAAKTYRIVIKQKPDNIITTHNHQARIGLARLSILQKNYEEAQSTLAPLLKINKNDPDANYLGGLLAFERRDFILAEKRIGILLEMAPDHNSSILLMGKIKYALENYDQAVLYLNNYLNASPDDTAALRLLVSSYIALNKFDIARSTLKPALSKNPDDKSLLTLMSKLQIVKGDTNAGIKQLEKSIESSPDDTSQHRKLAEAYIIAGDTDKAIETLQTFQKLSKNPQEAKNLMIFAYLSAGQFQNAINIAQDMLAASPEDTGILALNGSLYVSSGNNEVARKYYEKALQVDSEFVTASIGLARIEGIEGNTEKAIQIYEGLIDKQKGGTTPMLALAELAKLQKRMDDMIHWLEMARQSAPDEVNPRISLANYYFQSKQLAKADLLTLEALEIEPANSYLLALHGRILIAQQRYNKALSPLKLLIEKKPDSAAASVLLGEVYMRLGTYGNARTHFGKALQLQPENITALAMMAEMELQAGAADRSLPYAKKIQQLQAEFYVGYKLEGDAWLSMQNNSKAEAAYLTAWSKQQTSELAIKLYKVTKPSASPDEAMSPLITWLEANPTDNKARNFLASAYQENQQNKKAILEYEKIIENAPGDAAIMNNLAWLYFLEADPRALQMAEKAYNETNGKNPYIRDTYGWILVQQGQYIKASSILKQAMAQSPDNPDIQYHYAVAVLKSDDKATGAQMLEKLLGSNKTFDGRDDARQLLEDYRKTQ